MWVATPTCLVARRSQVSVSCLLTSRVVVRVLSRSIPWFAGWTGIGSGPSLVPEGKPEGPRRAITRGVQECSLVVRTSSGGISVSSGSVCGGRTVVWSVICVALVDRGFGHGRQMSQTLETGELKRLLRRRI